MSRDPDEIREEIDRARGELGETLEAIGDRVAPKHVAQRVKGDVDDKIDAIGDKVSPKRIFQRRTAGIRSGLRNRGESRMDGSTEITADDGMSESTGTAPTGGDIGRQAQNLRQRLRRASGTAVEQVTSAPAQARARSESNPLVSGLVAFGGGLAVAALLPPSDRERKAATRLKGRIEPLKQQAVDAGKSVAEDLKPVAQSGLEQVKGRATQAAEELKGQAQGAAEGLKGQATDATKAVKGQSRSATQTVKSSSKKAAATVKTSARQASPTVRGTAKQVVVKKSAPATRTAGTGGVATGIAPTGTAATRPTGTAKRATATATARRTTATAKSPVGRTR